MTIKAVFFDAFKTLIDLKPSLSGAFAELCQDFDHDVSVEDVRKVMPEIEKRHYIKYDGAAHNYQCSVEDLYHRWVDFNMMVFHAVGINGDSMAMAREMEQRFNSGRYTVSYEDSHLTLDRLKKDGYYIGVISNGTSGVKECLTELGYYDKSDFVLVSALVGWEKPSPNIFQIGLEKSGFKPEEILFIGDNYKADILGSRSMGMHAIQIVRDEEVEPKEDNFITDFSNLNQIIQNVNN